MYLLLENIKKFLISHYFGLPSQDQDRLKAINLGKLTSLKNLVCFNYTILSRLIIKLLYLRL